MWTKFLGNHYSSQDPMTLSPLTKKLELQESSPDCLVRGKGYVLIPAASWRCALGTWGREYVHVFPVELMPTGSSHANSIVVCPQYTIAKMDTWRLVEESITFFTVFLDLFSIDSPGWPYSLLFQEGVTIIWQFFISNSDLSSLS